MAASRTTSARAGGRDRVALIIVSCRCRDARAEGGEADHLADEELRAEHQVRRGVGLRRRRPRPRVTGRRGARRRGAGRRRAGRRGRRGDGARGRGNRGCGGRYGGVPGLGIDGERGHDRERGDDIVAGVPRDIAVGRRPVGRADAEAPDEAAIALLDDHDVRARCVRLRDVPPEARADARTKLRLCRASSLRAVLDTQGRRGRLGVRDRAAAERRGDHEERRCRGA
ncbi:hypothetical protein [Sorangium sp. So ce426]|uniref:hypothetical protein n=1 Tax=Sorangium sp. So ce426 TaxID=3133312 RepID=UPI003F5B6177